MVKVTEVTVTRVLEHLGSIDNKLQAVLCRLELAERNLVEGAVSGRAEPDDARWYESLSQTCRSDWEVMPPYLPSTLDPRAPEYVPQLAQVKTTADDEDVVTASDRHIGEDDAEETSANNPYPHDGRSSCQLCWEPFPRCFCYCLRYCRACADSMRLNYVPLASCDSVPAASKCVKVVRDLPNEAFNIDGRYWFAKLVHEYMGCSSLGLLIAHGVLVSRADIIFEIQLAAERRFVEDRLSETDGAEGDDSDVEGLDESECSGRY